LHASPKSASCRSNGVREIAIGSGRTRLCLLRNRRRLAFVVAHVPRRQLIAGHDRAPFGSVNFDPLRIAGPQRRRRLDHSRSARRITDNCVSAGPPIRFCALRPSANIQKPHQRRQSDAATHPPGECPGRSMRRRPHPPSFPSPAAHNIHPSGATSHTHRASRILPSRPAAIARFRNNVESSKRCWLTTPS